MSTLGYTIRDIDGHTYSFLFPEKDKIYFECHLPVRPGGWANITKFHINGRQDWKFYLDNEEHPLVVENRLRKAQREMDKKKQLANYHKPITTTLIKICDDCHTETLGYGNEEHFNGTVLCHWCLELRLITSANQAKHPLKRHSDLFEPIMIALTVVSFLAIIILG